MPVPGSSFDSSLDSGIEILIEVAGLPGDNMENNLCRTCRDGFREIAGYGAGAVNRHSNVPS